MFQFRRFPPYGYVFTVRWQDITPAGLLHSDTCGSMCACHSPQLFAAYRVLLRPLMPRHSPCALCSLTIFYWNYVLFSNFEVVLLFSFSLNRQTLEIVVTQFFQLDWHLISLLLAFNCFVQFSRYQFKNSSFACIFKLQVLQAKLVRPTFRFGHGGHKWTRTTDLTLIRRAL